MRVNDTLHGFRVKSIRPVPEIGADMVTLEFMKNKAELIWLDREDENKTFFIAFKTLPSDDTGVFHILEHSVLCGSQKFPVKEPFVELLKGSLQTFLNAFTYPDKTVYPVSSRNNRDFLNLVDVYMDAVLHPLSISDPHAFRQEGWHYEQEAPEEALTCNGVVYNEMKGAYSSADTVMMAELNRMLFPENCYGFESGGDPEAIPALTYENYLASHARFYHPSNARLFLDGCVDMDAVLALLEQYLDAYDFLTVDADIPMQQPIGRVSRTCSYEIGQEESEEDKVIYAKGIVFSSFDEMTKLLGANVLTELLCGSNDAPLTKAVLDAGLAEDVEFSICDGVQQPYALLALHNMAEERIPEAEDLLNRVIHEQLANGLDRERLLSIINHIEFVTREKDFGSMPRGLVYGLSMLDTWLYNGDPLKHLEHDELFKTLRKWTEENQFEQLLKEIFFRGEHEAVLTMLPSRTLGEEKLHREEERLAVLQANMTGDELETLRTDFARLRERQAAQDTEEQLACLPRLSLDEVSDTPENLNAEVLDMDGTTVLLNHDDTVGIVYANLYFAIPDLTMEELSLAAFMTGLMGDVPTENYSVNELYNAVDGKIGRLTVGTIVYSQEDKENSVTPYINVTVAGLKHQIADMLALTDEIVNRSRFTDTGAIFNLLRQERINMEQSMMASGNSVAAMRSGASLSGEMAVTEQMRGISMLRILQKLEQEYEVKGVEFCDRLQALAQRVFTRERMTISLCGVENIALAEKFRSLFRSGAIGERITYLPREKKNEGYTIPAGVAYTALSVPRTTRRYSQRVASQFLTYDYLWQTVRVMGGAYGTGAAIRAYSTVFTSYRDPSPAASLKAFADVPAQLRAYAENADSLDKYILSTIALAEPLLTPRTRTVLAATLYFTGKTHEDRCKGRKEVLATGPEDFRSYADLLEEALHNGVFCVIGAADKVTECRPDSVEPLLIL